MESKPKRPSRANPNVLLIGADLTSNGGIASVIKAYYKAFKKGEYGYELFLLKTSYYKDRPLVFEILIFIRSMISAIYIGLLGQVGIFHIHSSSHRSFYRKAFFIVLGKILRKTVILHLHSSRFDEFFMSDNVVVKYVLPLSDVIVVLCSDWQRKLSRKFPKADVRKIENPHEFDSDPTEFRKFESGAFIVLFVGFYIESKGIRDIVQLAEMLSREPSKNVLIQMAGKGELEEYLNLEIRRRNLGENIELLGWISDEKKEAAFKNAHAFLLPSYNEGMPISILEAMTYGLPIISTNIAGIPDIVIDSENGYLFAPGDLGGFCQAIHRIAGDDDLREQMFYKNKKRAECNSKERIFAEVDRLYAEIRSAAY